MATSVLTGVAGQKETTNVFSGVVALVISGTLLLAGLYVASMAAYWTLTSTLTPTDDGLIAARPAQVFFETGRLAFNPEGKAVEAHSSLLFTLLIALGFFFVEGIDIVWWMVGLNSLATFAAILILYRLARRYGLGRGWSITVVVATVVTPSVSFWAAGALEAPVVMALQLAFLLGVYRLSVEPPSKKASIALSIVILAMLVARPDGFVTPLFGVIFLGVFRRNWPEAIRQLGVLMAGFTSLALWRVWYYGHPFPNTVYVKTGAPVFDQLGYAISIWGSTFVHSGLWLFLLPLVGKAIHEGVQATKLLKAREHPGSTLTLLPWFAMWEVGYWFAHGGDIYQERMLLVLFPVGALALVFAAKKLVESNRVGELAVMAPVVAFAVLTPFVMSGNHFDFKGFDTAKWPAFPIFERDVRLAETLKRNHLGIKSGAADKLGHVSFLMGTNVHMYDLLGLADEHIAHNVKHQGDPNGRYIPGHSKYDLEYTLSCNPDFVYVTYASYPAIRHAFIDGLDRQYLEKRGYALSYFSNWKSFQVLDVRERDAQEVENIVSRDGCYNVAVFLRNEIIDKEPTSKLAKR